MTFLKRFREVIVSGYYYTMNVSLMLWCCKYQRIGFTRYLHDSRVNYSQNIKKTGLKSEFSKN